MNIVVIRTLLLVMLCLALFLLLATIAVEFLPLTSGNNDQMVLSQAELQITRHEYLVKDAYIMAYRGDALRIQAIGEVQVLLPSYEQVQEGLMKGNASLGLPPPSDTVKAELQAARSDYLAVDTALRIILLHPDKPPDPVQVSIIAQHDRPYLTTMYTVVTLLQQEASARALRFLGLKVSFLGATMLVICLKYVLFTQRVVQKLIEEEKTHASNP